MSTYLYRTSSGQTNKREVKRNEYNRANQNKAFVVGFPSCEQTREADYLGVESGYNTDKLKNIGFTITDAKMVNAPVINELLLSLECELVHTVTVGSHMQLTGEVKNILADESILNNQNKILLSKLQPIIYDEERAAYLRLGEKSRMPSSWVLNLKNH